jgi:hypothetical protein
MQVDIAALALTAAGCCRRGPGMPHLDKVAGKPDVLRRASDWQPRAPGTSNLSLLNISARHVWRAQSPGAQFLANRWQGPCW